MEDQLLTEEPIIFFTPPNLDKPPEPAKGDLVDLKEVRKEQDKILKDTFLEEIR